MNPLVSDPGQSSHQLQKSKTTRRKHKNSHNGCKNCKQRRIKCDETLPECTNCLKLQQSRAATVGGNTYAKCSYLSLSEQELELMRLKNESQRTDSVTSTKSSPQSSSSSKSSPSQQQTKSTVRKQGRPLNDKTILKKRTVTIYPNKAPFFRKMFATFQELTSLAMSDRKTSMNRNNHSFYLKIHLTKMLLLSEVADIYFQTLLSFTSNYLKRNVYKYETMFHKFSLKYFGNSIKCQKVLISNLDVLTPCHFNYLTSSTMILSWNTIYQETELQSYASFTTGILSIISSGIKGSSNTTHNTLSMEVAADNIIQGFKSCFIPSYDHEFLNEIYDNLLSLANESLIYKNLISFLGGLIKDLARSDLRLNSISTYPPKYMYKLLTDWYSILPSDLFNLSQNSFQMENRTQILMCYYITISQSLQAIFPEVMFLFSLEFMGISPPDMKSVFKNSNYHYVYLARIYNFFKKRQVMLFNEIMFKSLDSLQNEQIFVRGVKLENIEERCVKKFNNTILKPENYPYSSADQKDLSTDNSDILFNAIQTYDLDIDTFLSNLSYNEIDLHLMLDDYNKESGFLNQDFQPLEEETKGNALILANPGNLETVYRIRLRLLHS